MTSIRLPAPLRPYANGERVVTVQADSVGSALDELIISHPDLRQHLFTAGELRPFVNIFLNKEDVRFGQGMETPLGEDDTLMIIPSIAGG